MDMNEDRQLYSIEIKELLRESLSRMIPGEFSAHAQDPVFITRQSYPMLTKVDNLPLYPDSIPELILSWAKLDPAQSFTPEDILVLDLETSGLGRGRTVAIMIGLGYYQDGEFFVEQIFLPDFDAEEHSFDRLRQLCETRSLLITFNGKSFDLPVLESRLLYHQIWLNLRDLQHLDLLHIARRLWKRKLPSCALETIEYYVLGHIRDQELDLPGAQVPQTYFHYLATGETKLIKRVFVHNQDDILHTAALFTLICDSCNYPPVNNLDARIDYHALARLYLSQQQPETAKRILQDLLAQGIVNTEVLYELATIYKREKDIEQALATYQLAAELRHPPSMLECAKILERQKDFAGALSLSQDILVIEEGRYMRDSRLIFEVQKRSSRLQKKLVKCVE
ncbi:MAG: ribonuclease H-like domain-containing protein [Candidatus Cloacimonetes bacterium]|nr:ribonuclease H-like domain-containing protein [Candidatus Cloacimonadota bacterium]MCB5287409.1 ribonuclease H-like domain-containing protein [Candidatus Cloacimonadota bacterium]MCK9184290.1 ribonuclease H-like domain-containing protein [Candidatus Cloacimonadota bacterium]MCK9583451.1 ribonuclease H-like domain-containing protein [Candidatus Cloacimonadota bacterium]MDY0229730.1 ribonuclease H-like domain-containing protein [Candidatus Cloacimonadaceae bacterium]